MNLEKKDFEEQFHQREYIPTPFGEIETVDISPKHITNTTPVLLASGWGETLELQKEVLEELYLSGRRVIGLRHAVLIKQQTQKTYPTAEYQKAQTILMILEKKHIQKIDAISHSEGSINLAIAATLQTQLFRHFVLVTPAGISGKDNELRIVIGFLRHAIGTRIQFAQERKRKQALVKKALQKQVANPIQRIGSVKEEMRAMARYNIYPLLIHLRKKGIKIAILAGETDTVFPLEKMKQHLERRMKEYDFSTERERNNYGIDIFATKKGGHELYLNTHEIMQQVLRLEQSLDEERG